MAKKRKQKPRHMVSIVLTEHEIYDQKSISVEGTVRLHGKTVTTLLDSGNHDPAGTIKRALLALAATIG